jgi:hypothetical protein
VRPDGGDNVLSEPRPTVDGVPRVDWDDIAWRVTGPEGGDRYVRMGIALVVLGIVAMAAVGFTPIFRTEDVSLTYDMMAEDPDDDTSFGVPNSQALGHANWALAGAFLTIIMGIVLILEGKRIINLRRVMVWHAEARATALFSLAAFLSSISLFAGASLLGLAESMPTGEGAGVMVTFNGSSPAAVVVVITMGLATAGMLSMAYYNSVLSVYRGGGEVSNRRMARFSMLLALLSLGGILFLRVGTIMTATVEIASLPGQTFEMSWPYTMSRIDYQSTLGAGEELKGRLDIQLLVASLLLLFTAMCGMSGLVGVSARSLGGSSSRVRRATAMPLEGLLCAGAAILVLAWAASTAPAAAQDSWGIDNLQVDLGWGLYSGVLLAMAALGSALAYVGILGFREAREALVLGRKKEGPEEAEEEGIPQPMVDQALEEEARARGELPPPMEPEVPRPPLRERLLLGDARRNQIIIGVAVVVAIILVAVLWPGGPGGGNGNGGSEEVVIEELPEFTWDVSTDEYLGEGEDLYIDPLVDFRGIPNTAIFIDTITVEVTWTDEADNGILWTNEPDTFTAMVDDDMGLDTAERSGENSQGGTGRLVATWDPASWIVVGNPDLVDWGDQEVYQDVNVRAGASMDSAGDQVTRFGGRTQADPGNSYTIAYSMTGYQYTEP